MAWDLKGWHFRLVSSAEIKLSSNELARDRNCTITDVERKRCVHSSAKNRPAISGGSRTSSNGPILEELNRIH